MNTDVGKTEKENENKTLRAQLWEVVQVICLSVVAVLQIFYYIGESIYYLIVPPPEKPVKGEIVLITGTGHGIGRELALLYASEGATVVGWDVNEENNNNTIAEIAKRGYPKAYGYRCDVSNRENVLQVAKQVQKDVGDVTVLINNAGIMPAKRFEDHTPEDIERLFKINIFAHCWTLEAFLPTMKKNNNGHVVALSSCAGLLGLKNLAPYCATKFAVRGLMESLREELRENPNNRINLTTICPYMVDTGLCKKPRIRFGNLMPLLVPRFVAEQIMKAQRTNAAEISIPGFIYSLNMFGRLLPIKAGLFLKDFFDSGVEPDF